MRTKVILKSLKLNKSNKKPIPKITCYCYCYCLGEAAVLIQLLCVCFEDDEEAETVPDHHQYLYQDDNLVCYCHGLYL